MPKIVTIAGCTSPVSRSSAVLNYTQKMLVGAAITTETIAVRKLPSEDLFLGRSYSTPIRQTKALIEEADCIIIAATVSKAAYNSGLKAFFDLLPTDAFRGKIILPIVLSGSAMDFPAIDYSLRAILAALSANTILDGVYLLERQVQLYDRQVHFDESVEQRLHTAINTLLRTGSQTVAFSLFGYTPRPPLVTAPPTVPSY